MATYSRTNVAYPLPLVEWNTATQWTGATVDGTGTAVTVANTDGTVTIYLGSGFTLDGSGNATGGTVTSIQHRVTSDATTTLETVSGLSLDLTAAQTQATGHTLISTALSGGETFVGGSENDFMFGYAGNDTLTAGGGTRNVNGFLGDVVVGGAGNDTFNLPGDASQIVSYAREGGGGAVSGTVNQAGGTLTDTFGNTDTFVGGGGSFELTTQADSITTGNLNDFVAPGAGNDTVNLGGGGLDMLYYSARTDGSYPGFVTVPHGITVNITGYTANGASGTVLDPSDSTDTFTGVEQFRGTQLADTFNGGTGDDQFEGMGGNDTMNGGGGTDTVYYYRHIRSGALAGVTVNLGTGTATDPFGGTDTLNSIENVYATKFNDNITGSAVDNDIRAFEGNDTIDGGGGFDDLFYGDGLGAGGNPTGTNGITITMGASANAGTVTGIFGTDTFTNIERIWGTQLNDTIVGGAFDDRFVPGSGSDTINGGGGYDQIGYYNSSINNSGFGVTVTTTATGVGTVALPGGFDTFTSVEQIVGSHNNDTFSGGTGDDDFIPYLGNDTIDGGAGTDWVSYNFDTNRMFRGAVVNLSTGVVDDPYGGTDTILNSSIENVRGTNQMTNGDVLTGLGDGIGNFFRGYAGADTINGLGGNDTVDYQGDIDNGGTAGAYVDLTTGFAQDGMGTYDMLLNIESAIGTNQDRVAGALGDVLIGDGNANVFFARGGLDYIEGRGGNDTIDTGAGMAGTVGDIVVAGAGNDSVIGGSGATFVYGNDGSDYMSGGSGDDWLFGGDFTGTVTGTDTLLGGDGVDVLAVGSAGGNAAMYGGNGNDIMYGGSGVAGNDSMIGGAGSDYMYGGSGGNDGYFFQTADLVAGDFDTIVGFDSGDFLSFSASLNGQIFGQQTTIGGVSGSYLSLGTWALWMPYTTWTSVQAQTFYNS